LTEIKVSSIISVSTSTAMSVTAEFAIKCGVRLMRGSMYIRHVYLIIIATTET